MTIQGDFLVVTPSRGLLLKSDGYKPGTLLPILHRTGQPPPRRIIQPVTGITLRSKSPACWSVWDSATQICSVTQAEPLPQAKPMCAGLIPSPLAPWLCNIGQVTQPFWASVSYLYTMGLLIVPTSQCHEDILHTHARTHRQSLERCFTQRKHSLYVNNSNQWSLTLNLP